MSSLSILSGRYPTAIAVLTNDLRNLVADVAPQAREAINLELNCIRYSHARCGYFCGLFPQLHSVQVVFEFGVLLPDPEGTLEGDGPHVRFVTVRQLDLVRSELRRLVAASFALPRRREQKLAMVAQAEQQRRCNELLSTAVLDGTAEDVQFALAAGADPNGEPGAPSPLTQACLHRVWDRDRAEIVRLLLAAGATVDDEGSVRALLAGAARRGRPDIVKLLLDCGLGGLPGNARAYAFGQ